METPLKPDWDEADSLLKKRDRYTEETIKKKFQKIIDKEFKDIEGAPSEKTTIEIDTSRHRYVTPVWDDRYVVVWESVPDPGSKVAKVLAVVPTQLVSTVANEVKAQVERVVEEESKGKIKLG